MKILIAGSLGHIGSALVKKLPDFFEDLSLVMIDNLLVLPSPLSLDIPERVVCTFIEGKIQQLDLKKIFTGVDVVIHLAATADAAGTAGKPELMFENNFSATQAIAQACLENNTSLIFPSTTSVYGAQEREVDEEYKKLVPQSPYAECKMKEEELLRNLAKTQGLKVVICRLGTVYGVSRRINLNTAVNKFCWQAVREQPVTVWQTALDQKRPYLFLDDAVNALGWIIKYNLFDGQIYNIVTGNHTVRDVLAVIREDIPTLQITHVQHVSMNALSYEVSSEKLKKTGFEFTGHLKEGVKQTISFLKNQYKNEVI